MQIVEKPLYGFGGQAEPAVYTSGKICAKLAVDQVQVNNLELLVVPDSAQEVDLIIGQTFCALKHIAFVKKHETVVFGYADEAPFKDIDVSEIAKTNFKVVGNVKIEPLNEREVKVVRNSKNMVLRIYNSYLKKVQWDLNTSVNKTSRQTPYKLLYGYTPSLDSPRLDSITNEAPHTNVEHVREKPHERIIEEQQKYKRQFDNKRYIGYDYDVGEVIVVRAPVIATGQLTKL
ncbi:hypothetical protein QE152_g39888 [Popillia japonica]|uniref:Uncharacterized protein n=1 Tax=Popillia japonica TaxID=7064 RepID=A0AAW1HSK1_POPJA